MRYFFTSLLVVLSPVLFAQIQSVQSGDWDDPATWDCSCVPDASSFQPIIVLHNVTISADITLNQVQITSTGSVTINSGVTVTLDEDFANNPLVIDNGGSLTVNGTLDGTFLIISPILVDGTITSTGDIDIPDPSVMFFNAGSNYVHSHASGGTIPTATWDVTSNILVNGMNAGTPLPPTNLNQDFGNFTWNCPAQGNNPSFHFGGQLNSVQGDLIFISSNGRPIRFNISGSGYTLSIGRDFINQGVPIILAQGTTSGTTLVTVGRDFTQTGGSTTFRSSNNFDVIMEVGRHFSKTVGAFAGGSGTGSSAILRFNGGMIQNFTQSGTLIATIDYQVTNNSTLNLGTSFLTGLSLTVTSGSGIEAGALDTGGAIQTGTSNGNIRVSGTRNYQSGSFIRYNGSASQFIGNGHPVAAGVNCFINNTSGVSLATNVTIGGNLTLTAGNLTVGNYTLTLGGNITPGTNNIIVSSGSSLSISGFGALGAFPFPSGPVTFSNFTLNRTSGSVTFSNQVEITGTVNLISGQLIFNNQTLTLSGTLSASGGALSGNSSSVLIITGSGSFGLLPFAIGGNTINTLTINRTSGSVSLDNTLTITNALNLQSGDFTNISGLRLSNGATLTRNSSAQLLGSAVVQSSGERFNVVYEGSSSMNTGLELPTTTDNHLGNLTIDGGPVILTQDIIVNGDVNLLNSTFNANGFNIELAANPGIWNRQAGSFSPGSGILTITGNITIQSSATPQFGNIIVVSGATLTAYSGTMLVIGNLQIDAGSTFNHNDGTISFTGSITQVFAGGGKTFNNINVNKTGGTLQLASTVNLRRALTVSSATTIESDGYLVLLSTSDGTTGNARIGTLPAGASITGNVTVQRYMSDEGRIYRYISAPVSGFSVAALQSFVPVTGPFTGSSTCSGCTTNPSMYYYNETIAGNADAGWERFPVSSNSETLQTGRGYAVFVRDDIIPGNVRIDWLGPVHQGIISLPVSFTNTGNPGGDGWNLVGNPYPSSIDWDFASGWTKTNISGTIAVRDNGAGGIFRYWDGATGSLTNGEIATGQSIWVRATASSPVLTINENAKTSVTAAFYRKKSEEPINFLAINLSKDDIFDYAYIRLREEALNTLDEYDGPKLNNALFDVFTFSSDSIPMAINALSELNCENVIDIGMGDLTPGTYRLSFLQSGLFESYVLQLRDRYLNNTVNLGRDEEYIFTVDNNPGSKSTKRFGVYLTLSVPVGFEVDNGTLISNYITGNQWYKDGELIEGATNQTFIPTESGTYTLTVDVGACRFQAPESYTHVVTSLEQSATPEIEVYPNPVNETLTIKLPEPMPFIFQIRSSNGAVIKQDAFVEPTRQFSIDVSELNDGMYFLGLHYKNKLYQFKFVKITR